MKPVDPVDCERDPAWRAALALQRPQRRQVLGSLALLTTGGVSWTAWRAAREGPGGQPVHRTAIGEARRVLLPDGSQVMLNTATVLAQAFDDGRRQLRLRRGEILVDAALGHGALPLVVETLAGRIIANEGRFTLRCLEEGGRPLTRVQVMAGQVSIEPRRRNAVPVGVGEERQFDATAVAGRGPLPSDPLAWTRGELIAGPSALSRFVAELGRYRPGLLRCDPAVADWPVTGVFPLSDTDAVLDRLAATLPLRIRRLSPYWVTVTTRDA